MSPPLGSPPSWGFPLDRFRKSGGYVPSTCLEDDQGCHKVSGRNNYKQIDTCIIALSTMCFLLNMADLPLLSWCHKPMWVSSHNSTISIFFLSSHTSVVLSWNPSRGCATAIGAVGQILCYSRLDEAVCATRCDGFEAGLILD